MLFMVTELRIDRTGSSDKILQTYGPNSRHNGLRKYRNETLYHTNNRVPNEKISVD